MFIASWCAWSRSGRSFFGSSSEITTYLHGRGPEERAERASRRASDQHPAFHDRDGPEVPVPALDRVVLYEAVAPQELDAVRADLHALVGAQLPCQGDLAGDV